MTAQQTRWHPKKTLSGIAVAVSILGVILACDIPGQTSTPPVPMKITLCAVDAAQASACAANHMSKGNAVTGDFRALGSSQEVRALAMQADGRHPLANTALTFTIQGQGGSPIMKTANTNGDGVAEINYQRSSAGTDTITASPSGDEPYQVAPRLGLVVHWLAQQSFQQPIIFLHGINEDANVIQNQTEWTALFEALDDTFDPTYIETFCYVDDQAYADTARSGTPLPPSCPPTAPDPSCASNSTQCVSQSAVYANAVELAERVNALHSQTHKPVTLMGYSMGAAIIRTMLAGCKNNGAGVDDANGGTDNRCTQATKVVDSAFFLNGVQQGSWLLTVKNGLDKAENLQVDGTPVSSSPFGSVISLIEQGILNTIKHKMGLDGTSSAARDLTPQSNNIEAHNSVTIPSSVSAYTFYGDIRLQLGVNEYLYPASGTAGLTLGDLVLLPQQDQQTLSPIWGGASLCDDCNPPDAANGDYHGSRSTGQFHAWALTDRVEVNLADIVPTIGATFQSALNAPEEHFQVTGPTAQAPGSSVQVEDITGLAGSKTTDMAYEILLILEQRDNI